MRDKDVRCEIDTVCTLWLNEDKRWCHNGCASFATTYGPHNLH